ncbi:hypothetical protein G7Y89_g395 [Cudoniella acicularis]|uniref:Uncharacterized protein n=1 Tax=Cudoniella acicularis TaxID=354080 RepID=A0A8H4RXA0_9HELO|nr:hypothetical protein G7Y89_g395 [Cudoniella acicularis]
MSIYTISFTLIAKKDRKRRETGIPIDSDLIPVRTAILKNGIGTITIDVLDQRTRHGDIVSEGYRSTLFATFRGRRPLNPTSVEEIKYIKALPVPPPIFSPRPSLPAYLYHKSAIIKRGELEAPSPPYPEVAAELSKPIDSSIYRRGDNVEDKV